MRGISTEMQVAITGDHLRPVYFVQLDLGSTVLYLTDRSFNLTWDGKTWLGNGWLRPIRSIEETSEVKAVGCEIVLAGTISSLIALALSDVRLKNKAKVWLGLLNIGDTPEVLPDPYQIFSGKLDVPVISTSETEITLTLNYESDLRGLNRPNEFRFTDQAQKAIYPSDKGFEYVVTMETWDGYWGKPEKPSWLEFKRTKKK